MIVITIECIHNVTLSITINYDSNLAFIAKWYHKKLIKRCQIVMARLEKSRGSTQRMGVNASENKVAPWLLYIGVCSHSSVYINI